MLICLDQRTGTGCATENKDGAQFCRRCGRPLRFALQLRNPGDVVGAYRVVSVIGHGGFGAVYLAEALQQPGQRVALKETFDPDQIQSYQAEFAVLARLQHPHLPRYHTVFEADGNGYLVMEYVPGQSLQEVLDRQQGPLLEAQVLGYAIQLCDALAFLHSQNPPLVHRDIKPANVRLTPEGLIKLVDFGLVKEGSGATRSSRRGVTPAYAPPEQWGLGGQHTDARSDLYALGATLYHLLTGQEPLPVTDRIAASNDPLPSPRQLNPTLSLTVAAAVTAAMVLRVDQRPAEAQTLKRMLLQQGAMPFALPPALPPVRSVVPVALPPIRPAAPVVSPSAPARTTPTPVARPTALPSPKPRRWIAGLALAAVLAGLSFVFWPGRTAVPTASAPFTATPTGTAVSTESVETAIGDPAAPGRTQVRWFVGLGTGSDPAQQAVQLEVVDQFNNSQDKIQLILEVVPFAVARDTLITQLASGDGPDLVGPVGKYGFNAFYGQWMDLTPLIEKAGYDTTQFSDALIKSHQTEEGQVGLPFAVFPAAVFYQKAMFDDSGLNYPPKAYGEKYIMPDGTEVDWSWETLAQIAKILTIDQNGNDATAPEFDKNTIYQYGYVPQFQSPNNVGAFFGAGKLVSDDNMTAQVPEPWGEAWKWWYDGMWGEQPFIPAGPTLQSSDFGSGNPFNSGNVAMAVSQVWYTCCVSDAGGSWDFGVLPSNKGEVHGRIDADTFHILKGSKNPDAAFEVLSYLIGPASSKLLRIYGAMPARAGDQDSYFAEKSEQYPWVENWDAIKAGLDYPDIPSADSYTPNFYDAMDRVLAFQRSMENTADLDIDKEIETLTTDLQVVFDASPP